MEVGAGLLKAAGKSMVLTVAGFGTGGRVKVAVADWAPARAAEAQSAMESSQQAGLRRSNRNADIKVTVLRFLWRGARRPAAPRSQNHLNSTLIFRAVKPRPKISATSTENCLPSPGRGDYLFQ
jgi:hypothetical protein